MSNESQGPSVRQSAVRGLEDAVHDIGVVAGALRAMASLARHPRMTDEETLTDLARADLGDLAAVLAESLAARQQRIEAAADCQRALSPRVAAAR